MTNDVAFRWLGVAGLELAAGGCTLLIDPYVTRIPFMRMWLGRVRPDRDLITRMFTRADAVLVSHAHFDHVMDVPDVVRNTGADAFGSPNACRLLSACGAGAERIHEIGTSTWPASNIWSVPFCPRLWCSSPIRSAAAQ
jgi:L-ascorbate metabolism protein UlaG (beta-lactamase superfamily)